MDTPPFHLGEHAAQLRAGFQVRRAPIRDAMPEEHRAFFAAQKLLFVASMRADGALAATVLAAEAGFIVSPDPRILDIRTLPDRRDPFHSLIATGARVGLLGIDLATKRRNRVNGRILSVSLTGFATAVEQSFGNCPKYIQARTIAPAPRDDRGHKHDIEFFPGLDAKARNFIASADTFFVASSSGLGTVENGGIDISHRGGMPGFVGIEGNRLCIPDFAGNRYFNTLGNFLLHPSAALLFIDFEAGDLLHLTGTVQIDWGAAASPAAVRSWTVDVQSGWRWPAALPYRWFRA